MLSSRKRARDFLKSIRTVSEFNQLLDSLVLTDEERDVARDIYLRGLSHVQISFKYNMSIEKSHKIIQHILDRVQ